MGARERPFVVRKAMHVAWLGWVVGLLGLGVGFFLLQQARNSAERVREREAELARAQAERDEARAEGQRKQDQQRERTEEIAELRRRVEKLKRRAKDVETEHRTEPERLQQLEGQLAQARREADLAKRAEAQARADLERVADQARSDLERAERARAEERRSLEVRLEAVSRGDELVALRAHSESALARVAELETRAQKAEADAERYLRRWEATDRAYMVLRGEKGALEDELRTKTERIERLEALEVALAAAPSELAPVEPAA